MLSDGLAGMCTLGLLSLVAALWSSLYGNGSIGCTNYNYASREKCKKCGQPEEIAAMPTIAAPGASLPTYSHYFARAHGGAEQQMNVGLGGNGAVQHLPLSSNWSLAVTEKYGVNSAASWALAGRHSTGLAYDNPANQAPPFVKEWCNGEWICNCGFHNYSSHAQCKKCNAPPPSGTKHLASEECVHEWDNRRLNSGYTPRQGFEQVVGSRVDVKTGVYASYTDIGSVLAPNWQAPMPFPHQATVLALVGKGAKQWRDGD